MLHNKNVDEIIENKLELLIQTHDDRLLKLNQDFKILESVQNAHNDDGQVDWKNLSHKIKEFEESKNQVDYLRKVIQKNNLIDTVLTSNDGDGDFMNKIKLMRDVVNKFDTNFTMEIFESEIYFEMLNYITMNNKSIFENWLINIKFPIFEGKTSHQILEEFKITSFNQFEFFSDYLQILSSILKSDKPKNGNSQSKTKYFIYSSEFQELFTSFLFKKIRYTIITEFLDNKRKDDTQFEKDFIEFFTTLIKYISRAFHNTFDFITFCLDGEESNSSIKEKSICLMNYFIGKVLLQINSLLVNNQTIQNILISNDEIFLKVIKLISGFNRSLKKEYNYDVIDPKLVSLSDIITVPDLTSLNIDHKIKLQKKFTSQFIKTQIKEKLTSTIEKNEYNTEEIFDMIKLIIKDNYQFSLILVKNSIIFSSSLDQNLYYCLKEILNVFRASYNEEVQIFSLKKNVSRKKILFILDLIIKFLIHLNKLNEVVTSSSLENFSSLMKDINKMIDNYTVIIIKDLRTNGFDEIIDLFIYDNLMKLEEDKMKEVFTKVKNLVKVLFADLEKIKVSLESENYFFNSFLTLIINKIKEECENSLKRIPRNKNFDILTDKTNNLIEEILSRYTINQVTLNSVGKLMKNLKKCFNLLNMNKI